MATGRHIRGSSISLRKLRSWREFLQTERLQQEAWGLADIGIVPAALIRVISEHGGLTLGAFRGDELVGFSFGFPSAEGGVFHHHSHMTAVRPALQFRGIGLRLKLRQREEVLGTGLTRITWTFDPLQSVNAYLNLHKLGVTAGRYLVNYYGEIKDELNRGLPTDRLWAEWVLDSPRVQARLGGELSSAALPPSLLNEVEWRGGLPRPKAFEPGRGETVALQIPADIGILRARDEQLALAWRLHLREALSSCFERGYEAVDFVSQQEGDIRRGYYVLRRPSHAG